ncbi:MAG: fumarate hydratase [Rhodospirillaceae bacterium TMED8]|nr:fumarate hydratase [Magnetovibrio sp.]OUT48948.1 MAG: fumarate hydratase [Rhodospirillaceae bacterium TMED8]|tara:strand:+ start:762 stop:2378 length:1617 start_codon:yes stop_codon:yes gene_type:complete
MTDFIHRTMFELSEDYTPYRKLSDASICISKFKNQEVLTIEADVMKRLANEAYRDVSHLLRPKHLEQLASILSDPEASENDRYVALDLLKNANIAAGGILPMCQDTGNALVFGKKGQGVWTGFNDEAVLAEGIRQAYAENNLRYSMVSPMDMFAEVNTGDNMPVQFDLHATDGDEYSFLFIAKGGGSANKTFLYQQTKALLNEEALLDFLDKKIRTLGTAACPPYHLAIVIGGTSAEMTLKATKLASCRYLDALPTHGNPYGQAYRDLEWEAKILAITQKLGIGAQFGGKYFCHDVRVIRLARHGASCPVGVGVSCSADRQIKAKITRNGVFLEQLETNPAKYMPDITNEDLNKDVIDIDLNQSMDKVRATLSKYPIKTRLNLSGALIVARDIAHAKLKERIDSGEQLPQYFKDYGVYYAGPAKTPKGYASGSFGPTTAGRMDPYVDQFQAAGGSLIMLAKGNRSSLVTESCKIHGGFYLGSIGGPAARLAKDCIKGVKLVEYEELGMEAIWKIDIENFPAFIVIDDKGNDFFAEFMQ